MDDEQVKQINSQIENAIAADEMDDFADGLVDANDGLNVAIQRGQAGEPILRIEIRRHGNENDQPYQLRINELRRVIRERWNVDVKKVIVDGEFQF